MILLSIFLFQIYGWEPKPYKNSSELPEDSPQQLKDFVKQHKSDPMMGRMVWLTCEGENPADKENLGKIEYQPMPGIPDYYFPFENQENYLSPGIFARLTNPKSKFAFLHFSKNFSSNCCPFLLAEGVLIAISCKAWAKNIKHDQMDRMGLVHFELMID